jgi:hypothetical protein
MKLFFKKLQIIWHRFRCPENVFYGNGLKRDTALKSVGEGWSIFINNLYDAKPKYTRVVQVKEKFGQLRFYVSIAPNWYFDLINYYQNESYNICEICGKEGKVREDLGWLLTLCNEHYQIEKDKI